MEFSFAKILIELRAERNFNQTDLANLLCPSRHTISTWECGKRFPDFENIKKLAQIFEVPADYLLGLKDYY